MQWIIIQSDSQLIVNSVNGKNKIPKNIINLVENVKILLTRFSESRMEHCSRIDKDTNVLNKKAYLKLSIVSFSMNEMFLFLAKKKKKCINPI